MVLGIGRVGNIVAGANVSNYTIYKVDIWNSWDELGLMKGLYRRPNESNIVYRSRIVDAVAYNASRQGLTNYLSKSMDLETFNVNNKFVYLSVNAPLSYIQYNKITDPTEDYFPPQVIVDGVTFQFPMDDLNLSGSTVEFDGLDGDGNPWKYTYDFEKTVIYEPIETPTTTWTLWKNIDQSYLTIWETNSVPAEIKFKYQMVNTDGNLVIIEESSKRYTRDENGDIVEE